MPDAFDVEGMEELKALIERFPEMALDAAEPAMEQALLYLHGKIPQYPDKPQPGEASKWWTPKQRRWFWWAFKAGKIQVPYRRTGTLGRQITEQVTRSADGVEGEIGTNTPYAPWVIGPDEPGRVFAGLNNSNPMFQAGVHRKRWWQFEAVVNENLDGAYEQFRDQFLEDFEAAYAKPG